MRAKSYTLFFAGSDTGKLRRVRIPFYILHGLAVLAVVGGLTVAAAVGSYSRMLWKVTNYNAMRRDEANLKQQYQQLESQVKNTNQRLNSLQSLASEVAVSYGIVKLPHEPFSRPENPAGPDAKFEQSVAQYQFLEDNASEVRLTTYSRSSFSSPSYGYSEHAGLLSGLAMAAAADVPSLWPVRGELTGHFGERMDPFSGEGAFHSGVDIGTGYGQPVRVTADGTVKEVGYRGGYGQVVIVDHGYGITTWYAHLSAYNAHPGMQVKRGDVIGYVGRSGRATAPHLHYEVRLANIPVNPWRYLRGTSTGD